LADVTAERLPDVETDNWIFKVIHRGRQYLVYEDGRTDGFDWASPNMEDQLESLDPFAVIIVNKIPQRIAEAEAIGHDLGYELAKAEEPEEPDGFERDLIDGRK